MSETHELSVVIGAGPTGRGVAERLVAGGRPVRLVTRSGRAEIAGVTDHVAADLADPQAAQRACAGAGVVFGCVGFPSYRGWSRQWPPVMEGMLAGAAAADARFVFADNLYMYGPVDGPLHEELPLTDYGRKPALRANLTSMWQEAHASGRARAVAVRASDFYSPGVRLAMLGDYAAVPAVAGKVANVLGNADMPHTFTYVPDVTRALVDVADAGEDVLGQAWHVPSAPAKPVREVIEMIYREAGHSPKLRAAPAWLVRLLGVVDPNMREVSELMYQWTRPFRVDHAKFAARFWGDYTPLEDGIRDTVSWLRSQAER